MDYYRKFKRGHDCIRFLIQKYKIKELFIPYYLCDVVRHTAYREGCRPVFYHVDDNFMPALDFPEESFILYPNYFGICGENVKELSAQYPNIIIDNAHAFFDLPKGFASFNSGIKFNQGENAYLWIENEENVNVFNTDLPQKQKCRNRFIELHKIYSGINQLNIKIYDDMFPFCYPLLTDTAQRADRIAKDLTQQGLTIYRYWNNLPKNFNEYKFYSRLVPIPVAAVI